MIECANVLMREFENEGMRECEVGFEAYGLAKDTSGTLAPARLYIVLRDLILSFIPVYSCYIWISPRFIGISFFLILLRMIFVFKQN